MPHWRFRNDLWVVHGVLMYRFSVIIQTNLRQEEIANLHSAHQEVTEMNNRTSQCVFWPGFKTDIEPQEVCVRPVILIHQANPKCHP